MLHLAMSDFEHKNARHPIYLEEWRKSLTDLSQAGFADALGMHQSSYSYIESGTRRANLDQLFNIADYLGIEPEQLFRSPEDPVNGLIGLFAKVPKKDKKKAVGLFRAILKESFDLT
ncbi:helix-turn-helix domain-containing protein [Roseibium album]|uniref:helix-turn-helix domain-containing protein n=1 Tax=Roseibium album TaxID=311410 RepID=UPI0024928F87|nr:helix-turn-helix transcriptional regulator [Roseibium album]